MDVFHKYGPTPTPCCLIRIWLETLSAPVAPRGSSRDLKTMLRKRDGKGDVHGMYIENIDALYGYALVLARNHAEAEDLVQETYVRAIRAMRRLNSDSNVKGWLFTILRNIWLNQLRRQRTARIVAIDEEENETNCAETANDPYSLYVSKWELEQVRDAIQQLPTDFCQIILLREFEELSYQEIAAILDCPAGTVMSRLARARTKLRTLLSATRFDIVGTE